VLKLCRAEACQAAGGMRWRLLTAGFRWRWCRWRPRWARHCWSRLRADSAGVRMADTAGIALAAIGAPMISRCSHIPANCRRCAARAAVQGAVHVADRLIYMANQIGKFFESQGQNMAVPASIPKCARPSHARDAVVVQS